MLKKSNLTKFSMLALTAGMLFGACQKEVADGEAPLAGDPPIDMTGRLALVAETIGSGSKMISHDPGAPAVHQFKWHTGDQIHIANVGGTFSTQTVTVAGEQASIPVPESEEFSADQAIVAFTNTNLNPRHSSGTTYTIDLPSSYEYKADENGNQILDLPMVAYRAALNDGQSDNPTAPDSPLKFKALTAIIAVKIDNIGNDDLKIKKISLTADKSVLWRTECNIDITADHSNWSTQSTLGSGSTTKGEIELVAPDNSPITIASHSKKYFFFPVNKINITGNNYNYFTIKITDSQGNEEEKRSSSYLNNLDYGKIAYANINWPFSGQDAAVFTVNSNGRTVKFTSGNLLWNNGQWDFEDVWNLIDYSNMNIGDETWNNNKTSLFVDPQKPAYTLWHDDLEYHDYGEMMDPTTLTINGEQGFDVLTKDEWKYLFNANNKSNLNNTLLPRIIPVYAKDENEDDYQIGILILPDKCDGIVNTIENQNEPLRWDNLHKKYTDNNSQDVTSTAAKKAINLGAAYLPYHVNINVETEEFSYIYDELIATYWSKDNYIIEINTNPLSIQSTTEAIVASADAIRLVKVVSAGSSK
ncbi:MAG: hypothetical protein J6I49_00700 [Bacteroidales bacterium]|nr:hypothetical protein [Bacteroidales bacterium]